MNYREVKGDLFQINLKKWVLAHCISADVTASRNMNKGIAKTFREKFPDMASSISSDLKVGKAIRYKKDSQIIYNLITKEKVWQKAKGDYKKIYYMQLKDSLIDMKNQMLEYNEKSLAMPKIASGLDGGDWSEIRQIIKKIFEGTEINIQIRYLDESIEIGGAKYKIEKAKSGRSKCRSCGEKIDINTIRLKESIITPSYTQNKYYCRKCAEDKLITWKKETELLLKELQ
ncbi:MAG: hypothetical protein GF311_25775 [Candidatus Lokiarchaeota archaeon]|nr:hypothetical protein [Candidatus Lokiarchaeota archaeon]